MVKLTRRALSVGFAAMLVTPARSQRLSDRPLTIIVPFSAGSGPDVLARLVGEQLRERWGQTVVIDNKPGASGNIGAAAAAKAQPDGHSLLLYINTVLLNAALARNLPFDPVKDFAPVGLIARGSLALSVNRSVDVADAKALVARSTERPDELTYASPGRGTPHHFAMELFKLRTGAKLRHVPFSGTSGAVQAFLGGHVTAMFIPIHIALEHARDGTIRLLGVGSSKRAPLAASVPTLAEQGIAGTEVDLWYGLSAPAGTPPELVQRFNNIINDMLSDAKVRTALDQQGLSPAGGTTKAFADLIAEDLPRWKDVVQRAGLTATE